MALLSKREAELFAGLSKAGRGSAGKKATADMFHQARKAATDNKHELAGIHYAALAQFTPTNQNLPLRAARSYQKAERNQDAARWYLETAERYARMHQTTQAIATLRLYRDVAPGEHDGPKRIFNLCREKGNTGTGLFEFLSPKDQAVHKLRAEDIFSAFDDETFDTALDAMPARHLKKGEILTRIGEPAESIFIIVHGRIEGFLAMRGKRTRLGYLGAGDICSAVPYFTGGRRTSEIIASEPTDLLELPYHVLDSLCEESAEFREHLDILYRLHMLTIQLALAPVFKRLEPDERTEIARQMQMVECKAGELIFAEGDSSTDVYLVRSGAVTINLNVGEQERQFKTMKTGAVVGEISVVTKGKRTATARAISDCRLLKLDGNIYQQMFDGNEILRTLLERRRARQVQETREFIRQINLIEGDDTCELLLKDIWRE